MANNVRHLKKILILSIIASIGLVRNGLAQAGGVVSAPVLESQVAALNSTQTSQASVMSTMNATIAALEKADREFKELMQKATWLRNLQTSARILYMIENLVCTSQNLNVRMSSIGYNSCVANYRFDMSIVKVQQSADYLGIILTAGVTMTAAERMKALDDVIRAFEEAQEMMVRLNKTLDLDILRLRFARSNEQTIDLIMNYDRSKK